MRVDRLANPTTTNARGAALLALTQLGRIATTDIPSMVDVASAHEPDTATRSTYDAALAQLIEAHAALRPFHAARAGRR